MNGILHFLLLLFCLIIGIPFFLAQTIQEEMDPDPVIAVQEEERAELQGYWEQENYCYLEIDGTHMTLRDGLKRLVMDCDFTTEEQEGQIIILPETDALQYPPPYEGPYAYVEEMYYEEGVIHLQYHFAYRPEESKEYLLLYTEEGPFDHITIRDEEYLEELEGTWEDSRKSYMIRINGNHMEIGWYYDETFDLQYETDFHIISYDYAPNQLFLIQEDLVGTEFYAFTRFEYRDGKLETNEMIMDADWDTSITFEKIDSQQNR